MCRTGTSLAGAWDAANLLWRSVFWRPSSSRAHCISLGLIGAAENELLFCGRATGHADPDAPVNTLVSDRLPLDEWATWV